MNILLFGNTLNLRGTTVALLDYARGLRDRGHSVSIACFKSEDCSPDGNNVNVIQKIIAEGFVVDLCIGIDGLNAVIDANHIDFAYFIRAGYLEPLPVGCRTGVHAVFQFKQMHGDVYAYISSWLSNYISGGYIPYVPHIVNIS